MTPPARCQTTFDFRFTEKSPIGTITLASLCRYLLEVADDHAYQLGIDFQNMFERGLTWALLRLCIDVPKNLETLTELTLCTWPAARESLYVYRDYEIMSTTGEILGRATSQWVILDLKTHKPVKPPAFLTDLYQNLYQDNIPKRWDISFTRWNTLNMNEYPLRYECPIIVRRSDTDLNGHTNTASYVEFMEEAIPLELYKKRSPSYLELNCLTESFEKEHLFSIAEINPEETEIIHTLIRKHDNTLIARAKTLWS
ncbi:acyl-[acyl-carrier-protein] thioesterase [Thermospira aquatica]|uniref:Acyl-ACP thioesterase n=1 Tax=Thermospira aquatica TaxID=2828656 RepID=A0AAX3BAY1_9SPIR|nr:acyl-ACP thioesterase domain-containing protein [Thermospira aquatica]URA09311.1 hypothetical protein KDW03_07355 [Thermospira aquatica]